MNYFLDACALISFFNKEPGWDIVADLLKRCEAGEIELFISTAQLLEVYYDRIRIKGVEYANNFLEKAYASPLHIVDMSKPCLRVAGRLKVSYSISFADSIACATAACIPGTLVTSDYELKPIEQNEAIDFHWIRPPPEKK
jgi:predicted nucleic acid-binding protein